MNKQNYAISFNCIVLIKSLEDKERYTTNVVQEGIKGNSKFSENPMHILEYQVNNSEEFIDVISQLTSAAKNGLKPIVNVDCHGDIIDGLEFENGSTISWDSLSEYLIPLNEATGFNLITVFSACYGAHFLQNMEVIKPAPCAFILAPTHEIYPDELIGGLRAFYNALFDTLDMMETVRKAYSQELQNGSWFAEFAATWYLNVVTGYVKHHCTRKECRKRVQALYAKLKAEGYTKGVDANSIGNLKRSLLNSNRTELTHRYFDRYFMLDRVPENRPKFEALKKAVEERLDELRATGKYLV